MQVKAETGKGRISKESMYTPLTVYGLVHAT